MPCNDLQWHSKCPPCPHPSTGEPLLWTNRQHPRPFHFFFSRQRLIRESIRFMGLVTSDSSQIDFLFFLTNVSFFFCGTPINDAAIPRNWQHFLYEVDIILANRNLALHSPQSVKRSWPSHKRRFLPFRLCTCPSAYSNHLARPTVCRRLRVTEGIAECVQKQSTQQCPARSSWNYIKFNGWF